ncbi:4-alpha-glucanotransferase [Brevibacterium daeguense]|nr:4-alpha-glucanotransferase [Brevibacterium daeguense]
MVPKSTASQSPAVITDMTGPLRRLAKACGVQAEYTSAEGEAVQISDDTLSKVLAALGMRCTTRSEVEDSLRALADQRFDRALPPFGHQFSGDSAAVDFTLPEGERFGLTLTTENGLRVQLQDVSGVTATRTVMADSRPQLRQVRRVRMPADLPLGEHLLTLTSGHTVDTMPFIVAPRQVPTVDEVTAAGTAPGLAPRRPWGLTVQLYSVRSRSSWGIGDFGDLRDLMAIGAEQGADFVLINPIHAQAPVPPVENSPYLPSSRQAIDPIYIRVEDIPEAGQLDGDQRLAIQALARRWGKPNVSTDQIDRDGVLEDKLAALEVMHEVPLGPARRKQLAAFSAAAGEGMRSWAIFNAICREAAKGGAKARRAAKSLQRAEGEAVRILPSGAAWPPEMTGPAAEAVREFAAEHSAEIDFWMWTQFIAAEQLNAAQRTARELGMRIGLVTDLAVGVAGGGADSWALADYLAKDVTVGAPADYYNQQGQDWSQPPWHPVRLAEAGYRPLRDLFRTAFTGAGGIRIDHIMGLFRLWWVPQGNLPRDGAYVGYDSEAILAVLALEAHRAGVIVIGEDLGTVAPGVRERLAELGVLGTSVMWFEQTEDGLTDPRDYRELSFATLNTHDMHPTAGYLNLEDIELSEELGLLDDDPHDVYAAERTNRQNILKTIAEAGHLHPTDTMVGTLEELWPVVLGLHGYLAGTSAQLVGVALTDVVGETRTQNKPGTSDEYPNWTVPLADLAGRPVVLEDLDGDERLTAIAQIMNGDGAAEPIFDADGEVTGARPGADAADPVFGDAEPADRMGGGSGRGARPAGRMPDRTADELDEDAHER